ncbi:MAG: phytanoyl-CoA dioxygenase family protein [Phycisphaeraceae bacterium]
MLEKLTDAQWQQYEMLGYLELGKIVSDDELGALQQRIDDIMLGRADVDYDRMLMQLDSESGAYDDAGKQSNGHKGATLNYRKIEQLEFDPVFLRYMQKPLFTDICRRTYAASPVACFRAMFMNKPAGRGTTLPWHQDRWRHLDRDPQITLWLALDPATVENGAVRIIPGSHHALFNPSDGSGFLSAEQAKSIDEAKARHLRLEPGECVLLHNWLLHASDVNRSDVSRRAFSVCYMDATTRTSKGEPTDFPVIFGDNALDPDALAAAKAGR